MEDVMSKKIEMAIQEIRELDGHIPLVLTRGGCFQFAKYLKRHFPEGEIYLTKNKSHAVFKYEDSYYDIRGEVGEANDFIPLSEDDNNLSIMESWNSVKNLEFKDQTVEFSSPNPIKEIQLGGKRVYVDEEGNIQDLGQELAKLSIRIIATWFTWLFFSAGYEVFNESLRITYESTPMIQVLREPLLYIIGMFLYMIYIFIKDFTFDFSIETRKKILEEFNFKSMVFVVATTFLVLLGGTEEYSIIRELIPIAVGIKILTFWLFDVYFFIALMLTSKQRRKELYIHFKNAIQRGVVLKGDDDH